jgi:hypothetical protein
MRILATAVPAVLIVAAAGTSAQAQPKEAAAARIASLVGAARPALSVAAPLIELDVARARPAESREPARKLAFLEAHDVAAQVGPQRADIERCYLAEVGALAHASRLDLTVVIARDGRVLALKTAAPGLRGAAERKVTRCVRDQLDAVQFPARRNDTTAVVPYVFQKTEAPDAGPQLSCWNPKGCR